MKVIRNERQSISFLVDQVRIWISSYQDELVELLETNESDTITDLIEK